MDVINRIKRFTRKFRISRYITATLIKRSLLITVIAVTVLSLSQCRNCNEDLPMSSNWEAEIQDDLSVMRNNESIESKTYFMSAPKRKSNITEHRHVSFLKVHKSASTTVLNIFLRFGFKRKLNFILPSNRARVISQMSSIPHSKILPTPSGEGFDMLCHHVIYNRDVFRKYLPSDTIMIGILRDPFEQFVSSVHYYRTRWYEPYLLKIPGRRVITNLLKDKETYEPKDPTHSFTNNRMAVDFGFPKEQIYRPNSRKIKAYISQLSKDFKLVMITEYFDESIILLRRYLNWSIKDVLYVRLNEKAVEFRWSKITTGPEDRLLHKKNAVVDYALYDYFLMKFWRQVAEEGSDFHEEVMDFKRLRRSVEDFCNFMQDSNKLDIFNASTRWSRSFTIDRDDCELLLMDEDRFTDKVTWSQYPHLRPVLGESDFPKNRIKSGAVLRQGGRKNQQKLQPQRIGGNRRKHVNLNVK